MESDFLARRHSAMLIAASSSGSVSVSNTACDRTSDWVDEYDNTTVPDAKQSLVMQVKDMHLRIAKPQHPINVVKPANKRLSWHQALHPLNEVAAAPNQRRKQWPHQQQELYQKKHDYYRPLLMQLTATSTGPNQRVHRTIIQRINKTR